MRTLCWHIRLAGAVVAILGALISRVDISLLGLFIQYFGILLGLDIVERRIAALEVKIEEPK